MTRKEKRDRLWARLMRHTKVEATLRTSKRIGECFLYTGPRTVGGYGKLSVRIPGRRSPVGKSTHVLSFAMFRHPVRSGFVVSHLCHQPACWNPRHLREETQSENCQRKGWDFG